MIQNKKCILIAEDDLRMRIALRDLLSSKYHVFEASDGEIALDLFYQHSSDIDLILLDIMMPKENGIDVIKELRQNFDVPVIILTAKVGERDQLNGFNHGADDYITKPFSSSLLRVRIEAVLRRSGNNEVLTIHDLVLDSTKQTIFLNHEILNLTQKEYDLLSYFMKHEDSALSRDQLINAVWGYSYIGDGRTIDTHVKQLRFKLNGSVVMIETVFGIGYRLRRSNEALN